ncbi:hypothetical protein [Imhoffiella purpurea]|uniref:Uncharacterized protein n=1 Tax=Imhoffiella purpurea TaxID=1249627 RepID=W9VIQ2_9GAMM|nr:hypothetical protein [Imhoffiella purpurea]EXJ15932.1 hypothetical protein D779_0796 [Imhoffiella purpurea]
MTAAVLLLAAFTTPTMPTGAELADRLFLAAITRFGGPCQGIARTQAIGTSSNGEALVAVACKHGGRHVLRIHTDNTVSYMTPCADFESRTGLRCFPDSGSQ